MYKIQWGILPIAATLLGTAMLITGLIVSLSFAVPDMLEQARQQPFSAVNLAISLIVEVITALLFLFPLWFIGGFLISLFPTIRLVDRGVQYRALIFTSIIHWREVDHIIQFSNGYAAVAINGSVIPGLNRFYFNQILGLMLRRSYPLLLISPSLADHDEILVTISTHIRENVIRETHTAFRKQDVHKRHE